VTAALPTDVLCDGIYHYRRCAYPDAASCLNGPSWHYTYLGADLGDGTGGGHCIGRHTEDHPA
jgi:hypothetical protein